MKTVWLLNHYAQEPGGPGGTRHYALARHLKSLGWRAIVIASSVEHGTGRQRLLNNEKWRLDQFDGVEFLWLRCSSYHGNGSDRIRNMFEYTMASLRVPGGKLPAPDIVVGSSVHPFAAWAGSRLASRYRVPFLFEIRDLWPETLIDMGRLKKNHPLTWALGRLERHLCEQASRTITLLPDAFKYLNSIGVPSSKIAWIPNGVEIDEDEVVADARPTADFKLMYFGAHGAANGLDNILKAMQIIQLSSDAPNVELRLIGDGPEKAKLMTFASDNGLNNVSFEPPVKKRDIPALAAEADAFVFNLVEAPVFKYGISSNKLFDYMAAKRPVIFCCTSSNNPVADAGAGPTVRPEDPQALADAIVSMAGQSRASRETLGANGRQHVLNQYSYRKLATSLARVFDDCMTFPK